MPNWSVVTISFVRLAALAHALNCAVFYMWGNSNTPSFSHFLLHATMLYDLSLGNEKKAIYINISFSHLSTINIKC
jgi:hypothetical protein